ncbi:MAG TPA: type II secretion system secretin GspD [Burkholderiales bacterium]|nr:type II secretion system secretin GspD [Burkholderiales bacterium]
MPASRLGLLLLAFVAFGVRAAEEPVMLNFVNADIEAVATAIGQMSKRNFLLDPRVKGTVNIVSSRPVPPSAAYDIFLSALRLQGFAAVESDGVVKILPEADAKLHLSTVSPRGAADGDRLQTRVYTLKYESAAQMLPVLRPIISPNNTIAVYAANNSLVITDYGENLRRIDRIIDAIDRPGGGEPVFIPLRNASATEMANTVNRLYAADAAAGADSRGRVSVAADGRTNSLIVRADNPARIVRIQEMVQGLDKPTGAGGNLHVIYLKNADAVRVAQTLRAVLTGEAPAPIASAAPLTTAAPGTPLAGGPGPSPAPLAPLGAVGAGGGIVQADPASNALIISAPDAVFANLKAVVDKLDVRRAQVHVEALIVEMTADKAAEFGIQWQALHDTSTNATQGFGGTNFGARGTGTNIIDGAVNPGSLARGLNLGVVRGQVTIPGIGTITNLAFIARALETDANANILSTPNLLTLDNEEAKIVIGQNVPFITGQYAQTGAATTATPFQTIERRDVGLTLRIKPQISEGGSVRLQIYEEVSSVQDQTNPAGIITNKRSLESSVLVDDGAIIVLGGLVQDSTSNTMEKVPLLGDIPLLGALFRYETRKQTKTNLMIFLRPLVMREKSTYAPVTSDRYREMLEAQDKARIPPSIVLPDIQTPMLPPEEGSPQAGPAPKAPAQSAPEQSAPAQKAPAQ